MSGDQSELKPVAALQILERCKRSVTPAHDVHVLTTDEAETIASALLQLQREVEELERVLRLVGTRLLVARQTGTLNADWHSTLVEIETALTLRGGKP